MGLQRDRRGIPLQWHTLRPCRQASTLFTSTRAAHLRTGSGFRVSVQTEQEPLTEAAALLDFRKKKRTILQIKRRRRSFHRNSLFVCVCGESGAAGLCCLRFSSAAVCHMRIFLQMSCRDGNLATRSPAGAAHPAADPAHPPIPANNWRLRARGERVRAIKYADPSGGRLFIPADSIARWPWRVRTSFRGGFSNASWPGLVGEPTCRPPAVWSRPPN